MIKSLPDLYPAQLSLIEENAGKLEQGKDPTLAISRTDSRAERL
jgi:hypothetical protein